MTIRDFMDLAADGTEFTVYDMARDERIYDSPADDGSVSIYDIYEMEVHSWEIENGQIIFNVDTDED